MGDGGLTEYSVLNPYFVVVFQRRRLVRVRVPPAPNLPVAFGPLDVSAAYVGLPSASPRICLSYTGVSWINFLKLIDMLGL